MTKMRVEAQDNTFSDVSALYEALKAAAGKYSTMAFNMYSSHAINITTLVSILLDQEANNPNDIMTSAETIFINATLTIDDGIIYKVIFPSMNQNYDMGEHNFNFKYDAQKNTIESLKPMSAEEFSTMVSENKPNIISVEEFLHGIEQTLISGVQKDFDENTDPKIKEVLKEKDSNFINDCRIESMPKEHVNYWTSNLYPTLKLTNPSGKAVTLWETLFSGSDIEREPQYLKQALWNVLEEDISRYLPGIISNIVKENPIVIDINPQTGLKSHIKDVLGSIISSDYAFDESNYNRIILHKRIPDEFKPEEPKHYIHIVNELVTDPVRYVKEFMAISGEICASDLVDEFYRTHNKNVFAVVLYGLASAEFPHDVYSHINEETGLRELGQQRGEERTEAWLIPSQTQLIGVITDIPGFPEKLQAAKIPLYDVDITSLQPEKTEGVWYDKTERIKVIKDRMQEIENGIEGARYNAYETNFEVHPDNQKSHDAWIDSNKKYLEELEKEYKNLEAELKLYVDDPQFYQLEDVSKQFGLEFYGKKARLRVLAEKVRVECE